MRNSPYKIPNLLKCWRSLLSSQVWHICRWRGTAHEQIKDGQNVELFVLILHVFWLTSLLLQHQSWKFHFIFSISFLTDDVDNDCSQEGSGRHIIIQNFSCFNSLIYDNFLKVGMSPKKEMYSEILSQISLFVQALNHATTLREILILSMSILTGRYTWF